MHVFSAWLREQRVVRWGRGGPVSQRCSATRGNYGWVFARKPVIDDATYPFLLSRKTDQGYDIGQFRRVPQTAEQIGTSGFQ